MLRAKLARHISRLTSNKGFGTLKYEGIMENKPLSEFSSSWMERLMKSFRYSKRASLDFRLRIENFGALLGKECCFPALRTWRYLFSCTQHKYCIRGRARTFLFARRFSRQWARRFFMCNCEISPSFVHSKWTQVPFLPNNLRFPAM